MEGGTSSGNRSVTQNTPRSITGYYNTVGSCNRLVNYASATLAEREVIQVTEVVHIVCWLLFIKVFILNNLDVTIDAT